MFRSLQKKSSLVIPDYEFDKWVKRIGAGNSEHVNEYIRLYSSKDFQTGVRSVDLHSLVKWVFGEGISPLLIRRGSRNESTHKSSPPRFLRTIDPRYSVSKHNFSEPLQDQTSSFLLELTETLGSEMLVCEYFFQGRGGFIDLEEFRSSCLSLNLKTPYKPNELFFNLSKLNQSLAKKDFYKSLVLARNQRFESKQNRLKRSKKACKNSSPTHSFKNSVGNKSFELNKQNRSSLLKTQKVSFCKVKDCQQPTQYSSFYCKNHKKSLILNSRQLLFRLMCFFPNHKATSSIQKFMKALKKNSSAETIKNLVTELAPGFDITKRDIVALQELVRQPYFSGFLPSFVSLKGRPLKSSSPKEKKTLTPVSRITFSENRTQKRTSSKSPSRLVRYF